MVAGMVVAASADDSPRGWGNLLGLLAGIVGCYVIWRVDKWRQQKKDPAGDPSPTPPPALVSRETPQVARVSSHPSHAEPDETGEEWYGRIVHRGGRVFRTARHIVRTGESPPEWDDDAPESGDDEAPGVEAYEPPGDDSDVDLPLESDDGGERPESFVVNDWQGGRRPMRETREQYARRCLREGAPRPRVVAGLIEHYGLSRAQAYRVAEKASAGRAA